MALGGKRPGAGRKKGFNALEAEKARQLIVERVGQNLNPLLDAQLSLAKGLSHVYRIEETGEGNKKKREHILVTDPEEIREFLDEHEGMPGTVNDVYYYITTREPNNQALDSLLNRAYGRPKETIEHQGEVALKIDV